MKNRLNKSSQENQSLQEPKPPNEIQRELSYSPSFESVIKVQKTRLQRVLGPIQNIEMTGYCPSQGKILKLISMQRTEHFEPIWKYGQKLVKIYKIRNIRKFQLRISSRTPAHFMKALGTRLSKQFCNIKSLELAFYDCEFISHKDLESLCSQIGRKLLDLKQLILIFNECDDIATKALKRVGYELGNHLSSLRCLEFSFDFQEIEDKGLKSLGYYLGRRLFKLESLKFCLLNCMHLTDGGLKDFGFDIVSHLTKLRTLSLIFTYFRKITDESLQDLLSKIGKYLSDLQVFNLALPGTFITGTGFKIDTDLPKMKCLSCDFLRCQNLSDEGLKTIASTITKSFPQLEFLGIIVNSNCNITDHGIESISNISSQLFKLKKFSLDSSRCEGVTDRGVVALGSQIGSYFADLFQLELSFFGCTEITDRSLKVLGQEIKKHKDKLIHLKLDFYGCKRITDEGFRTLILCIIKNLISLQCLNLDFGKCLEITGKAFETLFEESSRNLTNLKQLKLAFMENIIEDQNLEAMGFGVSNYLINLQELSLDLNWCQRLTNSGLLKFSSHISKEKISLQKLVLNLDNAFRITEQAKRKAQEKLGFITEISII